MSRLPELRRELLQVAAAQPITPPGTPTSPRLRWRSPVILAALAVAVAVVGVALVGGTGRSTDLAARAYAATSGPGVIHWRTDIANYVDGRRTHDQRIEGWASSGVVHIVSYDFPGGPGRRPRMLNDQRVSGGRERMWLWSRNDYLNDPAPTQATEGPLPQGDPFAAFRNAYREHQLHSAGPDRYRLSPRLTSSYAPASTYTYVLDPGSARPRHLIIDTHIPAGPGRVAHHDVSVFAFSVYEKLPATPASRAELQLLPHPDAGPSMIPASRYFAVLRTGTPPGGRPGRELRAMAAHATGFHLDPAGIRQARPWVWLTPGRGYLCIDIANSAHAIASSCGTLTQVIHQGLGAFSSGKPMAVAVPDGIRTIHAKLPRHAWRTFHVTHNLAILPNGGYHWRLR